jgi:hypothetical protein
MGIWEIVSAAVLVIVFFVSLFQVLSTIGYTSTGGYIPTSTSITTMTSSLVEWFDSILIWIALVWGISLAIAFAFGYYTYKVGQRYDVVSLEITGVSYMLMLIAGVGMIYGLYALIQNLPSIVSLPASMISGGLYSIMGVMIIGGVISAVLGLIWIITFAIGLSNMKKKTGINTFGSAMICVVLFFLGIPLLIGIFLYGSALSQLANQEESTKREKTAASGGTRMPAGRGMTYCPYCGAKVETDALFCPTCGSSLKKEG